MVDWVNPVAIATLLVTVSVFFGLWLWSIRSKNAAVVDLYWAPGFVVIAALSAFLTPQPMNAVAPWLIAAVVVWATRLGGHLAGRFFREKHEDARYAAFRANGGPEWWWKSLFQVFLLQAVLLWVIATPIHAVLLSPTEDVLWPFVVLGFALFVVGAAIEAIADFQLARFKASPLHVNRPLMNGMWAWCRRPNYFGEALVWLGLGLVAVGGSGDWWAMLGPAVLIAILLGVTGRLTEEHLARTKRGYAEYQAAVPAYIPRRPRTIIRQPAE